MPASPAPHAMANWRGMIGRVWRGLTSGRATITAGGVAFYGFLSLFPGLFALLALYGLVADPHAVEEHMSGFGRLLPQQVREVMQTELLAQVNSSAGTLGIELVGSILVAAWSATNGTEALMIAVAEIHDQGESRSRVRVILTALIFTLVAIVSGAIALAAVVALPVMRASLGLSSTAGPLLSWLRWPALAGLLLLGLAGLYRYGPPRAPAKWRWVSPGSVIAACLWLCGSALFSWFVANFTSHTRLDGSIAAITILLGWFLMTAYIVILGATIDVELTRHWST